MRGYLASSRVSPRGGPAATPPPCGQVPLAWSTPHHARLPWGCRLLAVRQSRTFPGVPDALAHAPAPPFGGFFVLPAPPELPEQPGFLHLPFQQTQGKLHIVVRHRDGQPRLPSGASGRAGRPPARARSLCAAVLRLGSTYGRHNRSEEHTS